MLYTGNLIIIWEEARLLNAETNDNNIPHKILSVRNLQQRFYLPIDLYALSITVPNES